MSTCIRFIGRVCLVFACLSGAVVVKAVDTPVVTGLKPQFANVGDVVELSPRVYGPAPFEYQWFKDGEVLEGATDKKLRIETFEPGDVGLYYLEVANLFGTSFSNEVGVVDVGDIGEALDTEGIVWEYGGAHPFYSVSGEGFEDGDALTTYPVSDYTLVDAVLETTLEGPGNLFIKLRQESEAGFEEPVVVYVDGELATRFWPSAEWEEFGVAIGEGSHEVSLEYDRAFFEMVSNESRLNYETFGISTWLDDASFESRPLVVSQPVSIYGVSGSDYILEAEVVGGGSLVYQWYREGELLDSGNGASLDIESLGEDDFGSYYLVVENEYGMTTTDTVRIERQVELLDRIDEGGVAFNFTESSRWQYDAEELEELVLWTPVVEGGSGGKVELQVTGPINLCFEWKIDRRHFDEVLRFEIDGNWAGISTSNSGNWEVRAFRIPEGEHTVSWRFNAVKFEDPSPATAWLKGIRTSVVPQVSYQPVGQVVILDDSLQLDVEAVGEEPLSYQWFKDGDFLSGMTSARLVISNTRLGDVGEYVCLITDASGRIAFSDTAQVEILSELGITYDNPNGRFFDGRNIGVVEEDSERWIEVKDRLSYDFGFYGDRQGRAVVRMKVEGVDGDPVRVTYGNNSYYLGNTDWVDVAISSDDDRSRIASDVVSRESGGMYPVWGSVTIADGLIAATVYGASDLNPHRVGAFVFDDLENPTSIVGVSGWDVFVPVVLNELIELRDSSDQSNSAELIGSSDLELALSSDFFYRMFAAEFDAEPAVALDGNSVRALIIDSELLTWSDGQETAIATLNGILDTLPRDFSEAETLLDNTFLQYHEITWNVPQWKQEILFGFKYYPMNRDARVLIDSITFDESPYLGRSPSSRKGPVGVGAGFGGSIYYSGQNQEYTLWKDGIVLEGPGPELPDLGAVSGFTTGIYQIEVADNLGSTFSKPAVVAYDSSMGSSVGVADARIWTSGQKLWEVESEDWVLGGKSLAVGSLSEGDVASLFLQVEGPAEVRFVWKSDYDPFSDFLATEMSLSIGNELIYTMYEAAWREKSVMVPTGSHVLEWRADNASGADHSSRSLVDRIRIVREGQESFGEWALREIPFDVFASFENLSAVRVGDQDNDGIPNFMEYAFGSDSENFDESPEIYIHSDELGWSVRSTMPWREIAVEADVGLQISYDLENWYTVKSDYERNDGELTVRFGTLNRVMPAPPFARLVYYDLPGTQ